MRFRFAPKAGSGIKDAFSSLSAIGELVQCNRRMNKWPCDLPAHLGVATHIPTKADRHECNSRKAAFAAGVKFEITGPLFTTPFPLSTRFFSSTMMSKSI